MRALLLTTTIAVASIPIAVRSSPLEPREQYRSLFGIIAASSKANIDSPLAKLGRTLFWDERLSVNGKIACASCHMPADGSSDRRAKSIDARDKETGRQSQPVYNATLQTAGLRWISDRPTAAAHAIGSMTGSMGFATLSDALVALRKYYKPESFANAFPLVADAVSIENMAAAIEAYEETLNTPAPFDRYLNGENSALTAAQKAGLRTFVDVGCAGCHSGPLLGGMLQTKFGLFKDYWLETKSTKVDDGKFLRTKKDEDRHVFRVAMLRNIADTAPYFHDGSVANLDDAVRVMARVQLGKELSNAQIESIVEFLKSLTGNRPPHYGPPTP